MHQEYAKSLQYNKDRQFVALELFLSDSYYIFILHQVVFKFIV